MFSGLRTYFKVNMWPLKDTLKQKDFEIIFQKWYTGFYSILKRKLFIPYVEQGCFTVKILAKETCLILIINLVNLI